MKTKTWAEFWQMFLQVTFHQGHPDRWTFREKKAKWLAEYLDVVSGNKVVDLGCGDGVLDICLSRMGIEMTSVDRATPVLSHARSEDDTKKVQFIESELQNIDFEAERFHGAFVIETLGLMNKEDDFRLLQKIYEWLKPGGKLMVDQPRGPTISNNWEKEFDFGKCVAQTSFDPETRIHQLNFEFHPKDGEPFGIYDPYDRSRNDGPGITRYIYRLEEMKEILERVGFEVKEVPHYYPEAYTSLLATKVEQ